MQTQGKARVAILVHDAYEELEVWYPLYRLQEASHEVVTFGPEAGCKYVSKMGYPVTAQKSYFELNPAEFDGVVVPGGYAPDKIRRYPEAVQFVHDLDVQGKLVASICHGLWVLCSAKMLQGRRVTCYHAIKDDVINAGAAYADAAVVVDRNIVTSRKPDDLPAFSRAMLDVLSAGPKLLSAVHGA